MSVRLRSFATAALLGGVLVLVSPIPASAAAFTVDTTTDAVDATIGDGICATAANQCSLRAAVQEANASPGDDTIALGLATYTLTIVGAGEDAAATGDLDVTSGLITVTGAGTGSTLIVNNAGDRIFDVRPAGRLDLSGIQLKGGTASDAPSMAGGGSGGAVLNAGTLNTQSVLFTENTALRAGGAIEASEGSQTSLSVSYLNENTAPSGNGGAVHVTGAANVTIEKSGISTNTAAEGGGLWNSATGTMTVTNAQIGQNKATGPLANQGGGAIFNAPNNTNTGGGSLTVTGGRMTSNNAVGMAGTGGGIFNGGAATLSGIIIDANTASAGGGIETVAGSTTSLTEVILGANAAQSTPGNGGGLHITGAGTAEITDSTIRENEAAHDGGGLWNSATGTINVTGSEILKNAAAGPSASNGGGAIFNDGGVLTVDSSTLSSNHATGALGSGGGIFNKAGVVTIANGSSLLGNTAARGGGIESAGAATTTITEAQVNDNEATKGDGGGIHVEGGTTDITQSMLATNTTIGSGGGLAVQQPGKATLKRSLVLGNISNIDSVGGGGGLLNAASKLLVSDSVIIGNEAHLGAGVLGLDGAETQLNHVTLTRNSGGAGAGVYAIDDGSINRLSDSIVAGNLNADDCGGAYSSAGGNVVGSCAISDTQDITGITDPMIDVQYVPQPGSPAIDRALDASTVDLALTVRPLDGNGDGIARADSGAREAPGVPTSTEPTVPGDGTTTSTTLPGDGTTTSTTRPGDTTTTTGPNPTTTINPGGGPGNGNVGNAGRGTGGSGSPRSLPRTGSSIGVLVGLGLSLLGAGALILGSRRRLTLAPIRR